MTSAVPSHSRGTAPATCADAAIAKLHEGGIRVCFASEKHYNVRSPVLRVPVDFQELLFNSAAASAAAAQTSACALLTLPVYAPVTVNHTPVLQLFP
jgi:hypothetical protein